jgi:hypothetical protein
LILRSAYRPPTLRDKFRRAGEPVDLPEKAFQYE